MFAHEATIVEHPDGIAVRPGPPYPNLPSVDQRSQLSGADCTPVIDRAMDGHEGVR